MSDKTLLPCPTPWCDGDEQYVWQGPDDRYHIICGSCAVEGPGSADEADAATAWNTRATPAPDSEKLREAGAYVAGPVYRSSMEPEGDVWSAEVQVTGGYYVAAEVYGSTEAEARARQSAIIAALGATS